MTPRIPTLILSAFFLLFSVFAVSIPTFADSDDHQHNKKQYFLAPDIIISDTIINGVDVTSGKLIYTDLSSTVLGFSRTYSADDSGVSSTTLGGWNHQYASRLLVDGLPYNQWNGLKSKKYKKKKKACTSGWENIKKAVFNGKLSRATARYKHGLCRISLNGKTRADFVIHRTNHSNSKTITLSRHDGSSMSFVKHRKSWKTLSGIPFVLSRSGKTG